MLLVAPPHIGTTQSSRMQARPREGHPFFLRLFRAVLPRSIGLRSHALFDPAPSVPNVTRLPRLAATVLAVLAVACAAGPAGAPRRLSGDASGSVWGQGVLDFRPDSTFSLSWGRSGEQPTCVSRTWEPRSEGVALSVCESRVGTDRFDPWCPEPGTDISVLLNDGHAIYLAVGGIVDLNWATDVSAVWESPRCAVFASTRA